jgi:hypothetical protein
MKKTYFLYLPILGIFAAGCKKTPETVTIRQERGYICENYTCKFVETGATYLTLLDCKSECADTSPGTADLSVNAYVNSFSSYTLTIGLAYSAADIMIGAYFDQKTDIGYTTNSETKSLQLINTTLPPGTYYYQMEIQKNSTTQQQLKTGVFTVKSRETTGITHSF